MFYESECLQFTLQYLPYNQTNFTKKMLQKCKKNVLSQLQSIRNLPKNSSAKASILILDTVTAPVLSEMFSIEELLEVGVKDLCRIDKIKKPEPTCIAIYYISCKSLQSLYNDFRSSQKQKVIDKKKKKEVDESVERSINQDLEKQYLYMSINLLFCEEASDDTLRDIAEHQEIIERIASFGELYIPCRFSDRNIAIIPFSNEGEKNIESLRRMTKSNTKLLDKNSVQNKKQQQQKQQQNSRKRQRTAHNIHKQNLSCIADIYQFERGKDKKISEQIETNLKNYGKKLCQSIMGGTNIGLNTIVKVVYYQSKFTNKLKQIFISNFTECMQAKSKQLMQGKLQEEGSPNQFKPSLFAQSSEPQTKQLIVILADRQADNLSPLVRSFYYQPFLMDLFDIKDPPERKIHIISPKIAPTTIEVEDKIFCQYSNMFINDVFTRINPSLQQYMTKNKAAKFHKDKVTPNKNQQIEMQEKQHSAKQLKEVIKQLPEYKKTIKSYNTNIQILNVIGNIAKEKKVYEEGQLEHSIITGFGGDKKQVKDKKILQNMFIMLQNKDVTVEDKCRLMVLAVCCLDIDNSERNKVITRLSKIQGHGDIALAISKISSKGIKKYPLPFSVQKSNKDCYMDRHQCTLSLIMQQIVLNNNNPPKLAKSFKMEQVKPLSVIKKPQIKGSLTKQKSKTTEYVVSMCGGLGYNEISDIERVLQNSNIQNINVNFVTDYVFTPIKYLQQLCTLL